MKKERLPNILIMGIDAGFSNLGLVCIDIDTREVLAAETIRTERTDRKRGVRVADDDTQRCQALARGLREFYRRNSPHLVVVELPHGGAQGARANRAMGMATGVVAAWAEYTRCPFEWITPGEGKRAATGSRGASKAEVEEAVLQAFAWPEGWLARPAVEREHQADAAAAVLAAMDGALLRAVKLGMEREREGRYHGASGTAVPLDSGAAAGV